MFAFAEADYTSAVKTLNAHFHKGAKDDERYLETYASMVGAFQGRLWVGYTYWAGAANIRLHSRNRAHDSTASEVNKICLQFAAHNKSIISCISLILQLLSLLICSRSSDYILSCLSLQNVCN
jgi:hypothetical protein